MHRQSPRARSSAGYLAEDTIAALTTAVGGAIAVVRVSGPQAFAALSALAPASGDAPPRQLRRALLRDPQSEEPLDDALSVRFVSPGSFTGEDVVELHIHGGSYLAHRLMESLERLGVRQALPGEFSFRAVRNGKMTLAQASAVADLIQAGNDGALALALEKLSGSQNRLLSTIAGDLRQLAALGEIGIDFSDQDVEEVQLPALKRRLEPILDKLRALQSSYPRGVRIQEGIRVAFVGLPNAGKSSFFNAILGEDRSIVSEIPGTTRDLVHERITLRGARATLTLRLEDTAGLRVTSNPIEKSGIDRSHQAARDAELVFFVVDATSSLLSAFEQWRSLNIPASRTLGVLTKLDLVGSNELARLRQSCAESGLSRWVETSAQTGSGISEAVETLIEFSSGLVRREQGEVILTRSDQLNAVAQGLEALERARTAHEIDLFASDLRQALHQLGPLIGETLPDDILGQIFSEFCIGK